MNATILKFPYERINLDVKSGEAKILKLPVRKLDLAYLVPFAAFAVWMEMWGVR